VEVHPPESPIHSLRDFLVHMFTITLGLLIALGLEGLVERHHHRALVAEAHENIHQEIQENRALVQQNLASLREDDARLSSNLELLRRLRDTGHLDDGAKLSYSLNWSSFSDSAWTTARDTGAFGHMQYDQVQCYAGIYAQQNLVNEIAVALFQNQTRAVAPALGLGEPERMTPAELERMIERTGDRLADLKGLEQIMSQWNPDCAGAEHPP
jgi:hypothetical protein